MCRKKTLICSLCDVEIDVEIPEGQKRQEGEPGDEHHWAEATQPDAPRLCGGSISGIGIDCTNNHTDCKNLKVFPLISELPRIAVDQRDKRHRESMRDQEIQFCSRSNIHPPVPCQQAPSNHNQQTERKIEQTPMQGAATNDQAEEQGINRSQE